jgi:drug/metabolite transporter (DMT)-like permease
VLFALGGIWGGSFLFIKVIVDETGPLEVATRRLFLGALAIAAYVAFARRRLTLTPRLLGRIAVLAVVANVVPFFLISWGEQHIESGTASVLNATVPIFTAVVAAVVLDEEHFTRARLVGLLLGFVGVATLAGTESLDVTDSSVSGQLAIVGAAFSYGIGAVYVRSLLRENDAVALTAIQIPLAFVISAAVMLAATGAPDYSLSLEAVASLLALGTLGTGIGYIAFVWLIDHMGSVRASLVTYVVPVLGLILGWLVLDESIGVNTLAGFFLIIAGVATVMRGQALPAGQEPA